MLEPLKLLKILQNNHKCTKLYFLRRGGVSRPAISNSDTNDEQLWKSAKVGINKLLYPIQRSNRQFAVLPWLSPTAVDRPTPGLRHSYEVLAPSLINKLLTLIQCSNRQFAQRGDQRQDFVVGSREQSKPTWGALSMSSWT